MRVGSCARAMADNGETKGLITHHQSEFLHNYYTFVSLHDSDHEGVVRIFKLCSPFLRAVRLFNYITLD